MCIHSESFIQWHFACVSGRRIAEAWLPGSVCTCVLITIWKRAGDDGGALELCRLFESGTAAGGIVKALCIPNGKTVSNARIKTKGDVASRTSRT